ncbi:MAG: hypothetical protein OXC92_05990 [Flavobacteriaceae bacterium]|nr:hypothetical protein [Flavobacteriaceae bacterium]MCY4216515.1 hypothetical protein [Flavobacteriaceae bacterium]MCY4254178.1 hypothetical protein [Flavobacteriaceae bacterium]
MVKKVFFLLVVLLTFNQCLYVMFPKEFEVKVDLNQEDAPNDQPKREAEIDSEIPTPSAQVQDSLNDKL